YLIAFNGLSAAGWAYVIYHPYVPATYKSNHFSTTLAYFLHPYVPATYKSTFSALAPVQSLAALEVLHVLLGFVRSPFPTTVVQVSSRLVLVWGIVERFP
ncbi:hypothetical protein DFJ58DRAFT_631646, partial [Suillus subalutaceus]|uniref:uncharacterized protein n=1 Tax=Suillus subalutaceus TaxID=48586 RepID=UPI001B879A0A